MKIGINTVSIFAQNFQHFLVFFSTKLRILLTKFIIDLN